MALFPIRCYSDSKKIYLENHADLIVTDEKDNLVMIRFGGYPEMVTAMADVITAGCTFTVETESNNFEVSSKKERNFIRKTTHDGIYAECVFYLKDNEKHVINADDEKNVNSPRNLYIFCKTKERSELFSELDKKLSVPLINDFQDYFIDKLIDNGLLQEMSVFSNDVELNVYCLTVKDDESDVVEILENGLKQGEIKIPGGNNLTGKPQNVFNDINGFSSYLKEFGNLIAERIKKSFVPLFDPQNETICEKLNEVNEYITDKAGYALFDAQLAAAEGLKRELDKSKLAMIIAECGTGKTKIGSAALYAHQNEKNKKSFNAVICPSHVCEKWVREIEETIPNCFAMVVDNFQEIEKMRHIYKTDNRTVYCIISKEKSRDGYMKEPAVIWSNVKKAFVCPDCGEIQQMPYFENGKKYTVDADCFFYRRESNLNHKCENCGTVLWSTLNPDCNSRNGWVKISDFGFIHRKFVNQYLTLKMPKKYTDEIVQLIENPEMSVLAKGAYRRYPLSSYIKKKVKKLDGLIIDELHEYSGNSGQGAAMAELTKVSKKVIAMTATLINGYSKGMFYLLFRLAPSLMKLDNQEFDKSTDFCREYGVVEKVIVVEKQSINSMSKGISSSTREKFLPGVSPIVYSRFLLDNAVFLALDDMGKSLPDYEEIPISVDAPEEIQNEYNKLKNEFLLLMKKDRRIAQKVMSTYLNLLTAYPDQPYGHPPVINPFNDKDVLIAPKSIGDINTILPKDETVLEIVERKVRNGERVIIYTAWTRLDTREKLMILLNKKMYRTKILDVNIPSRKREEWVDKQVAEGIDVLIVNPTLIQTGLDLNAFTTLVFYNVSFNLYVLRQASRRSWRINQTASKVEVYMLYYTDTLQHKALKLMASKLAAATLIEGGITDDGLAAMSDCKDLTSQMAKELADGIRDSVEDLSSTFKKMAKIKAFDNNIAEVKVPVIVVNERKIIAEKPKIVIKENKEIIQYSLFDLIAS